MSMARTVGGAVFVTLLCSRAAFAELKVGASPQSVTQRCSLYIPRLVGIAITDQVDIALGADTSTMDTVWPKYRPPTKPAESPSSVVWYWTNNPTGAVVATRGSGDWSKEILLGQLYYAPAKTERTKDGEKEPSGAWVAFTDKDADFDHTSEAGTKHADLDYEFEWEPTDPPFSGDPVKLTYTVITTK